MKYIIDNAAAAILNAEKKAVIEILVNGLPPKELSQLKSMCKEAWLCDYVKEREKLANERKYATVPINKLVRLFEDPKSGRRNIARKYMHKRFEFLPVKEKHAIIRASLNGVHADYEWAYVRLLKYWDDKFLPRVIELWEQLHDELAGLLVIQHAPLDYVRSNRGSFPSKYTLSLSIRLKDDADYVVDKAKVPESEYMRIMSILGRTVDYETAKRHLYCTFLSNIDQCCDKVNNIFGNSADAYYSISGNMPVGYAMRQLARTGRQDVIVEFVELYESIMHTFSQAVEDPTAASNKDTFCMIACDAIPQPYHEAIKAIRSSSARATSPEDDSANEACAEHLNILSDRNPNLDKLISKLDLAPF